MGTVAIDLLPDAASDPLFAGLPASFSAQATHLQSVLRAPEGAAVLARSVHDACHAFRWGDAAWGVQFHPEFGTVHMRGYVQARADALAKEGRCAKRLAGEVAAAPHARQVLRRFVRHARGISRPR
jgi:GMP synthase (glutamine-hydrolysing)